MSEQQVQIDQEALAQLAWTDRVNHAMTLSELKKLKLENAKLIEKVTELQNKLGAKNDNNVNNA